jgi:dienelactone hydrolase
MLIRLSALLLSASLANAALPVSGPVEETFSANGKPVGIEMYEPASPGRYPAVVLLHGADGIQAHARAYRHAAEGLSARGYVVLLPRYFEATGTGPLGLSVAQPEIARHFMEWLGTAAEAVDYARSRPDVEPERVGLLGFSLGASIALAAASQDQRIRAVVEYYGLLPAAAAAFISHMPPVLILHGTADPIVPVEDAYSLEHMLKAKCEELEMKIYPGQGHGFAGEAADDSARRAVAFLDRFLKN